MTNALVYIWLALIGLSLGSFLNVLILRDKQRLSILTDRSACPHCKHTLGVKDLVPVLSFMWLRGKCRYCKKPISWQYPLIELMATGLVVLAGWYGWGHYHSWVLTVTVGLVWLLFLAISVIDIKSLEIPLEYVLLAALIGAGGFWLSGYRTWQESGFGLLFGAGMLALVTYGWKAIFKEEGMGEGDIWLAGAIGAIVGFPLVIVALFVAVMLGAVGGIILLGVNRQSMRTAVPFGPFLFLGLIAALIWGQTIIHWYVLGL